MASLVLLAAAGQNVIEFLGDKRSRGLDGRRSVIRASLHSHFVTSRSVFSGHRRRFADDCWSPEPTLFLLHFEGDKRTETGGTKATIAAVGRGRLELRSCRRRGGSRALPADGRLGSPLLSN